MLNRFLEAGIEPWRNGRGETRVLYSDAPAGIDDWALRVSVADISGPSAFSIFTGVDRHLLALGPGRLRLRVDDAETELGRYSCHFFSGEAVASAEPEQTSTHVLNVMTRRDALRVWMTLRDARTPAVIEPTSSDGFTILVALRPCIVDGEHLEPLDSIVAEPRSSVTCTGLHAVINAAPSIVLTLRELL